MKFKTVTSEHEKSYAKRSVLSRKITLEFLYVNRHEQSITKCLDFANIQAYTQINRINQTYDTSRTNFA